MLAARTASKLGEVAAEVRARRPPRARGAHRHHPRRGLPAPRGAREAEFGRIDVLVNNAFDMGSFVRIEDASAEDFLRAAAR